MDQAAASEVIEGERRSASPTWNANITFPSSGLRSDVRRYEARLYSDTQLATRHSLAWMSLEDILTNRTRLSEDILRDVKETTTSYGVAISRADVKDLKEEKVPGTEIRSWHFLFSSRLVTQLRNGAICIRVFGKNEFPEEPLTSCAAYSTAYFVRGLFDRLLRARLWRVLIASARTKHTSAVGTPHTR